MQELPSGPGSVASNRLALGALALVVAGVTQLPSGILRAGVVSASARNLEVALGANSTAFRLGVALANVSVVFFVLGCSRSTPICRGAARSSSHSWAWS